MEISAVCQVDGSFYSVSKISSRKMPKADAEAKARRHKAYSVYIWSSKTSKYVPRNIY